MNCQIVFTNRQREISFSLTELSLQNVVHTVLLCENQTADFLSIEFLSDKETRRLHKKFFRDPSSTDCMSFPIDLVTQPGPRHLGDIVICPMTALKQSQNTPNLFFEEMTLYLIHGVLHLLGYDDTTPQERKIMRQREHRVMKRLRQQRQMLSGKLKLQYISFEEIKAAQRNLSELRKKSKSLFKISNQLSYTVLMPKNDAISTKSIAKAIDRGDIEPLFGITTSTERFQILNKL